MTSPSQPQLFRHFTANAVQLDRFPFPRELSMAAYLVENEEVLSLDQDLLSNVEIIETELSVKQGRASRNSDGRIDILSTYSQEYIGVIELKLGQLEELHLAQLEDYLRQRDEILKAYPDILSKEATPSAKWIGVLVGSSINAELAKRIAAGHRMLGDIPVGALTIQRYRSADGQVYVITDTYFGGLTTSKDASKYVFEGREFGKGRLVLEVVRKYAEMHPSLGFQGLLEAFPKTCQGSLGVFSTDQEAREIQERTGRSRHFISPADLVKLSDCTVAVCNQWGVGNIDRFLTRAMDLGYRIAPELTKESGAIST